MSKDQKIAMSKDVHFSCTMLYLRPLEVVSNIIPNLRSASSTFQIAHASELWFQNNCSYLEMGNMLILWQMLNTLQLVGNHGGLSSHTSFHAGMLS